MKKIFTALCTALCFTAFLSAQDISYNWALSGGGENADRASVITSDANGNIYTAGVFQETATFGSLTLTGAAKGSGANFDNNLFLTKMDGNKTIEWNIQSNLGAVNPTAVTIAANGDVILVGNMRAIKGAPTTEANIIDTESTITTFSGLEDAASAIRGFVARFDSNGKTLWVKEVESANGKNDVSDVAVDSEGNIYIVGNFDKNVTLSGGSQLTSTSAQAAYVAKLEGNTGNQLWVKTTSGGIKKEDFVKVIFDGSDLFIAGTFTNQTSAVEIAFGGVNITPSAYPDIVIAKLDKDGNFAYVQTKKHVLSTSSNTMLKDLLVKDSKIYLSGNFKGEFSFDGGSITSPTNLNGFIFAFDASTGADAWQKNVACSAITEVSAVDVINGKVYAYGYFYNKTGANAGAADFGSGITLTTGDDNTKGDIFFAVYELDGTILKAETMAKGLGAEMSIDMTSVNNEVYLWGHFNSTVLSIYGTEETLATQGGFDFFVTKYTIDIPNSIKDEPVNSDLKVFTKYETLFVNGNGISSVEVYNTSGIIVKSSVYSQGEDNPELSLSRLQKGIYVVKVKSLSGEINTVKIRL